MNYTAWYTVDVADVKLDDRFDCSTLDEALELVEELEEYGVENIVIWDNIADEPVWKGA